MRIIRRFFLILFVLLACVGCDQSTKHFAESNLPRVQAVSLFSDTLRLQVAHNSGAFLSFGDSFPAAWRLIALRGGVSVMLLALFTYTLLSRANRNQQTLALALILSGGASNLLDRFLHEGYVIDFINVGAGSLRTGIFNVADIAITIGVLVLLLPTLNAKVIEHPANPRPS